MVTNLSILFRILLNVFKILDNKAPKYLSELVQLLTPCRSDLRSSNPGATVMKFQKILKDSDIK